MSLSKNETEHYASLGYLLLTALPKETNMLLDHIESGRYKFLGTVPQASGIQLPFGSNVQVQSPAPRAPRSNVSAAVAQLEALVGDVTRNGNRKPFKLQGYNEANWPKTDPFGRPYPSIQTLAAASSASAVKPYLTNSGKPAFQCGPFKFYMADNEGPSHFGDTIPANSWRAIAQGYGQAATYITPSELSQALIHIKAFTPEKLMELGQTLGVSLVAAPQPDVAPHVQAPVADAKPARKRSKKSAA